MWLRSWPYICNACACVLRGWGVPHHQAILRHQADILQFSPNSLYPETEGCGTLPSPYRTDRTGLLPVWDTQACRPLFMEMLFSQGILKSHLLTSSSLLKPHLRYHTILTWALPPNSLHLTLPFFNYLVYCLLPGCKLQKGKQCRIGWWVDGWLVVFCCCLPSI